MNHCRTCFVTGTDTGIGKTRVTLGLMRAVKDAGHRVSGMKPVASGSGLVLGQRRNEDAVLIEAQGSRSRDYDLINPYPLSAPISPNFAARLDGASVSMDRIIERAQRLQIDSDFLFIEGVGGWRVPWSEDLTASNLVARLGSPVILVVGLRLGCINHALLTTEAIVNDGAGLAGWVANHIEPGNEHTPLACEYLAARIPAPLIGTLPYLSDPCPEAVSRLLDPAPLYREAGAGLS